jgi:hypothetical protein
MVLTGEIGSNWNKKNSPSATISWIGPVSNLGLRGERPVTYRPKNGTARQWHCSVCK